MNCKWAAVNARRRGLPDDGTLGPGAVPSIARVCRELGVSRKTVARALRALEGEGRLERQPGIGYVVMPRAGAQGLWPPAGSPAGMAGRPVRWKVPQVAAAGESDAQCLVAEVAEQLGVARDGDAPVGLSGLAFSHAEGEPDRLTSRISS